MALNLHLKNMTKDGLLILNSTLGGMDYDKKMTKNELGQVISDRITAQPPTTTQKHTNTAPQHNHPIGST